MLKYLKRHLLSRKPGRFYKDERGAIKILFTLTVPFMLLLAGAGIDSADVYRARINFQNATDAGALMAAKTLAATGNTTTASEAGKEIFFGNIRNIAANVADADITFDFGNGDCTSSPVVANATLQKKVYFSFLRASLYQKPRPQQGWLIDGTSQATAEQKKVTLYGLTEVECGNDTLEIALVLDNSGSMRYNGKISTLRSAAADLVNTLHTTMGASNRPDPVRFSLVPFSGMVNVGDSNKNASWMDTTGVSPVHHQHLTWPTSIATKIGDTYRNSSGQYMTRFSLYDSLNVDWEGCVEMRPYPHHTQDSQPTTSDPESMFVPSFAPDTPDNWTGDYEQILTISTGQAICESFQREFYWRRGRWRSRSIRRCDRWDDGHRGQTHPQNGGYRPHWDDRIEYQRGVFIGNTGGTAGYVQGNRLTEEWYQNNYLADDHNFPAEWGNARAPEYTGAGEHQHKRQKWASKYFNNPSIRDVNNNRGGYPTVVGATGGPNLFCDSQPITDLTANQSAVTTAISTMQANGSTNISQGISWGWRTLSQDAPFTRGRSYSTADNKKIMIVMTDGNNTYYPIDIFYNGYSKRNKSYYSAYDHSETNRIFDGFTAISNPNHDYNTFRQAMDSHMLETCANAKAAGIQVYTIAFDVPNGSSVKSMLETCSSDDVGGGKLYYDASNNAELVATFQRIAEKLSELSITK